MSESGDSDAKKPAPRADALTSEAPPRPHSSAAKPAPSGADDLAMWEDTTKVRDAAEMLRAAEAAESSAILPVRSLDGGPLGSVALAPSRAPRALASERARAQPPAFVVTPLPTSTAPSGFEMGRPVFAVAMVGLLGAGAAWPLFGRSVSVGVLIGAAFATANLWAFTRIGRGVIGRNAAAWGLVATTKLIVLFGGAFAVLKSHAAAPLPFLLGYLCLPVGIVLSQLLGLKSEFEDGEGSI